MRRAVVLALLIVSPVLALDGQPGMHDPSTVVMQDGRFYVYATGNGLPIAISDDGWTWRGAGTLMQAVPGGKPGPDVLARGGNNTWAPDLIRSGDKYFVYYSAPGTQPKSAIGLLIGTTLDPQSPNYKWEDGGPVVWSDGVEDSNAIDPGVFRDPTNGSLWLTYGSYFGYIRLVELDPKSGKRLYPNRKSIDIAINSEASIMIFRDGWYYLLVTHGSCCAGANSSYNIRMGRARKVTGPFLDNVGIDMLQGGGKLFLGSGGRSIGPGHFGLLDLGEGVQKFSLHFEADLDRGGISVLDIRPLLWRDGWPEAGANLTAGTVRDRIRAHRHGARDGGTGYTGRRAARARRARRCGRSSGPRRRGRAGRRRTRRAGSVAGRRAGVGELAGGRRRRSNVAVHAAGAAEVDGGDGAECRRLSRLAVLQDHDRGNGSRADGDARGRAGHRAGVHGCGRAAVARRSACRRHLSRDAESRTGVERATGALRRRLQHADARAIPR